MRVNVRKQVRFLEQVFLSLLPRFFLSPYPSPVYACTPSYGNQKNLHNFFRNHTISEIVGVVPSRDIFGVCSVFSAR